ncbi:uncharacterized protein [Palaemon carinicauda]|uniref:uncharacterized protein isoform X2 n=1 Tax=Palaemon carinicauda TaxID=392227 RepID=UPI0035B59D22
MIFSHVWRRQVHQSLLQPCSPGSLGFLQGDHQSITMSSSWEKNQKYFAKSLFLASHRYISSDKGPGGNMSYLPPWAPTSGGGPYPPHMLPPHHSPTSSQHTPSQNSQNPAQSNPASVYQNLSPVVKTPTTTSAPTTPSSDASKTSHISSPTSVSSPITSASNAQSASSGSLGPSSSSSSTSSVALGDPYQPQGFQRSESPPLKRPVLPESIKGEVHTLDSPTEMILGIPGPSALDFKARKISGKYPPPEQLAGPVMYSYQSRGRPRKNWTTATGLPTMIPITHPPMNHSDDADDEESKPFKCNLCGKSFKLKGGLVQHERTHSSDRPYVCPDCGKLFRQPTHLQQHLRIHTGEKPYECAFCDKTFRQRTILNQHLRIHTGEKPYACMECGKQFRQKAILDQHFRTHLGDKPYACPHPECRKHFREMATLISHMKCHKDVPDPRIVLQQAKRLVKEERDDLIPSNLNLNREQHGEGGNREIVQDIMEQNRGMGIDRAGQDRRLSMDSVSQERSMVQDRVAQERNEQEQRNNRCAGGSEQGRYQGSQEQNRQNHHSFPGHSSSEESSAQKSPHNVPQHSSGDQSNERVPSHSQPQLPPNMVPTPQMAMANLIPYPHSIFPATSYMMPPPDPRQYNPHSQAGSSHPRPSQ